MNHHIYEFGQIDHNMISEISIKMNIEEDGNIQFDKKIL